MYKLKDEVKLIFDFFWSQDGNDSLRRVEKCAPTDAGSVELGRSIESFDTRAVPGNLYIPHADVDKWAAKTQPGPSEIQEV